MKGCRVSIGAAALLVLTSSGAWAQSRPGGDSEPARTVEIPITQERLEQKTETVMTEKWNTVMHESQRTLHYPVTEYAWEPRWHGWLNPFREPHVAYHLMPRVRWQSRTETVRTPVTYRQYVPETRVVQQPVRKLGFVERTDMVDAATRITRRLPTPTPPRVAPPGPSHVGPQGVGGIQLLTGDPPRSGPQTIPRHGTAIR